MRRPHIILIDGESGVGKTTLANRMADALHATVVHLDDAYPGWGGLVEGVAEVSTGVLKPMSKGKPGRYTKWDWVGNRQGEKLIVAVPEVLIVEGCGSSTPDTRRIADTVIWLSTDSAERQARRNSRDGGENKSELQRWDQDVELHIERNDPIETASVRLRT